MKRRPRQSSDEQFIRIRCVPLGKPGFGSIITCREEMLTTILVLVPVCCSRRATLCYYQNYCTNSAPIAVMLPKPNAAFRTKVIYSQRVFYDNLPNWQSICGNRCPHCNYACESPMLHIPQK